MGCVTDMKQVHDNACEWRVKCPEVARRLHQWIRSGSRKVKNSEGHESARQLSYRSTKGRGELILDSEPTLKELTEWLTATYTILEGDAENRD